MGQQSVLSGGRPEDVRIDVFNSADYSWRLPDGWEQFRGTFGLGRWRWFRVRCKAPRRGEDGYRNEKRWVSWDYIITINAHPVGAICDYKTQHIHGYCDRLCRQINWAMRIPPTRLHHDSHAQRFAHLFAERHQKRLLRAVESPSSASHMLSDRPHTEPYQLGSTLYRSWKRDDDTGDRDYRLGLVLDKHGDRVEVLFERCAEPVIIRKRDDEELITWDSYELDPQALTETGQYRANQSRSRKAQRRDRNPDGTFASVGNETTTQPDPSRDRTGLHVGAA